MKTIATLMIAGISLASVALADEKPVLTVYTYDSFVSEWGPGPSVEEAFEVTCACDLRYVAPGDAAAVLSRLMLEGKDSEADVILGLDNNLMAQAQATGLLAPHGLKAPTYSLPTEWKDDMFIPFDWGYFAFVYDRTKLTQVPDSFETLSASDLKIVIQDPRSSSPGLGLLMWVKAAYGDRAAEVWTGLADNIVTVTPGWTEAYGMFLAGEADMVLSYTTSPAYHMIAESDDTKAAAAFSEGHYLQVEVAAKIASTDQPELAAKFLTFVTGPDFQSVIPHTNWMYPAVTPPEGLPEAFETLIAPEKALMLAPQQAAEVREAATEEWRAALSQ